VTVQGTSECATTSEFNVSVHWLGSSSPSSN